MIFEASGLGTTRFDACTALGAPNAIITLRTRWVNTPDIRAYATDLLKQMLGLWDANRPTPPVIRMQVYGDQVSESCYAIVLDPVDTGTFSQHALDAYRSVLANHRTQGPQPPITHDVCFLPSGHTVQFQGRA